MYWQGVLVREPRVCIRSRGSVFLALRPSTRPNKDRTRNRTGVTSQILGTHAAMSLARLWRDQGKVQQSREPRAPVYNGSRRVRHARYEGSKGAAGRATHYRKILTIRDQNRAERSTAGVSNIRAKLMLVLLCLLWGINWPVMKIALQEIPPLSMRTISSAFGALTLLSICAVSRRRFRIASAKTWAHVCVISLLNIAFFSILSAYAQITAARLV